MNSFAELLANVGSADPNASAQKGTRIPVLSDLDSVLYPELWLSVAGRGAALEAPGASPPETYTMVANSESQTAPRATEECAALSDLSDWQFDGRCGTSGAASSLRECIAFFLAARVGVWLRSVRLSRYAQPAARAPAPSASFPSNALDPSRGLFAAERCIIGCRASSPSTCVASRRESCGLRTSDSPSDGEVGTSFALWRVCS